MGITLAVGAGAAVHYANLDEFRATANKSVKPVAVLSQPQMTADAEKSAPKPGVAPPTADFARVLAVTPIEKAVKIPRQQCHEETITHSEPVKDKQQVTGMVSGALLGGILGHQVGDGRGKDLATVAGAAVGAYGGKKAQQKMQESRTWTTTEQRCETVTETRIDITAYSVRYEINGQQATVRMAYNPGKRIPLKNGNLAI